MLMAEGIPAITIERHGIKASGPVAMMRCADENIDAVRQAHKDSLAISAQQAEFHRQWAAAEMALTEDQRAERSAAAAQYVGNDDALPSKLIPQTAAEVAKAKADRQWLDDFNEG